MKVLMTVPKNVTNSFISRLYNGLKKYCEVDWELPDFSKINSENITNYDIINIHWPEALFNWREPNPLEMIQFKNYLKLIKKKSKIVYNVHNVLPHTKDSGVFRDLYNLVLENADLMVHLSKTSYNQFKDFNTKHTIMPHGNYDNFPNEVSRVSARNHLGIKSDEFVILSFGHIRGKEEIELLLRSFNNFPFKTKKLLVARGNLLKSENKAVRQFERIKILLSHSIIWDNRHIPEEEVQYFINAADILFIPRTKSLNSSILILGYTFGKVVVGPNIGSIGEILQETGNPCFNPEDFETVNQALLAGFCLSRSNKGEENKAYALTNWNWDTISQNYIGSFKQLINS